MKIILRNLNKIKAGTFIFSLKKCDLAIHKTLFP